MTVASDVSWPGHMTQVVRAAASRTTPFGQQVHVHRVVTSTNDVAAQLAFEGCPEGALVVAAEQTRGRGRRGARFHSPPGSGLYCSTVLRPALWPSALRDPEGVPRAITLMAGVAVVEAARTLGATTAELKWPNDVIVRPDGVAGWRKLAGILAEASVDTQGLQHVVLGIGINVTATPDADELDHIATSLAAAAGRAVDLDDTIVTLLTSLSSAYRCLSIEGPARVVEAWRRYAPAMNGRRVAWADDDRWHTGLARSIDDTGALRVETSQGMTALISADLRWSLDDE